MGESEMKITVLPETFSVCRLEKDASIPTWALGEPFFSITRTADELSLVCPEIAVPRGVKSENGWRCLKVEGPLDFSLTGILASLTMPLAEKKISVFAISTYDTDYLLVKQHDLKKTVDTLTFSGFTVGVTGRSPLP